MVLSMNLNRTCLEEARKRVKIGKLVSRDDDDDDDDHLEERKETSYFERILFFSSIHFTGRWPN